METLEESYKHKLDPKILTQLITARVNQTSSDQELSIFRKTQKREGTSGDNQPQLTDHKHLSEINTKNVR